MAISGAWIVSCEGASAWRVCFDSDPAATEAVRAVSMRAMCKCVLCVVPHDQEVQNIRVVVETRRRSAADQRKRKGDKKSDASHDCDACD